MLNKLTAEEARQTLIFNEGVLRTELSAALSLHTAAPIGADTLDALRDGGELIWAAVTMHGSQETIRILQRLRGLTDESERHAVYRALFPLDATRKLQLDTLIECGLLQWRLVGQGGIEAVVAPLREAVGVAVRRLCGLHGATQRLVPNAMLLKDTVLFVFIFGDAEQRAALAAVPRAAWAPEAPGDFQSMVELLDALCQGAPDRTIPAARIAQIRRAHGRYWIHAFWADKIPALLDALTAMDSGDTAALRRAHDRLEEDHEDRALYASLQHEVAGLMCPWLLLLRTIAFHHKLPFPLASRYVPDVGAHLLR